MRGKILLLVLLTQIVLPVVASASPGQALLSDSFASAHVGSCFGQGQAIDANFIDVFNGYGSQCVNGNHALDQIPSAPISATDTHAALAISKRSFSGTLAISARVTTIAELRNPANDWEVGWLLWDYSNTNSFYYLILKPQGWEVGKEWCDLALSPCQSQQFLATGTEPSFAVGTAVTMTVDQVVHKGVPTFTIFYSIGNGPQTPLVTISDTGKVSVAYVSGSVGLYDEEANVAWKSITVSS